ncbi:MAG: hypothetical protein UY23_C0001G0302 [Candidatus Jorgensenbacteria bacterium GW2011_GWA1_48_11]|uniref:Uncharacterized protein n=1 Tax=Candidatus Jorgensenbacteria bacterium GW2011_GWA1_48_11 TaxID=1618660 RepID=A0A0G1UC14_9BACT|nr:MAG: hypothetical protein UY23_C0001G0302 [Candidatus Jorgensenbacteria bacterium GW2011_GWA1_48_11]KKW12187.1 MAG: hypothetical protein UY51_C0005G0429 [Candidatus Jorgensenbacteria bacterium GW2011_GWB1_49_9]
MFAVSARRIPSERGGEMICNYGRHPHYGEESGRCSGHPEEELVCGPAVHAVCLKCHPRMAEECPNCRKPAYICPCP